MSASGLDVLPDQHDRQGVRPGAGLTTLGALSLLTVVALVGAGIDLLTGSGLRLAFAIGLVAGSLLAAVFVRQRSLIVIVFAPPLLFLVTSGLSVLATPGGLGGGKLLDAGIGWLTYGFPAMAAAVAGALIVVGVRAVRNRA